jgi:hypothetical protein
LSLPPDVAPYHPEFIEVAKNSVILPDSGVCSYSLLR